MPLLRVRIQIRWSSISRHDGTWNKGDTASHGRTLRISGDGAGSARCQIPSSNHLHGRPDGCVHTRMHPGIDSLSGMSRLARLLSPPLTVIIYLMMTLRRVGRWIWAFWEHGLQRSRAACMEGLTMLQASWRTSIFRRVYRIRKLNHA